MIKVDPVFELYMERGILFLFRECHSWEVENLEKKILTLKLAISLRWKWSKQVFIVLLSGNKGIGKYRGQKKLALFETGEIGAESVLYGPQLIIVYNLALDLIVWFSTELGHIYPALKKRKAYLFIKVYSPKFDPKICTYESKTFSLFVYS